MSLAIAEAIYRRWNDASLNEAVASLYFGDRDAAPEGAILPRAQYCLLTDRNRLRSRVGIEMLQPVRFLVWASTDSVVGGYLDTIEFAFRNAEAAQSSPVSLASEDGTILSVDGAGRSVVQEDEQVFRGTLQFDVQWIKPNTRPN
jgi:hypothetical protein